MWFLKSRQWQLEQRTLEILSSLSCRTGKLSSYLNDIACGVSQLINVDWSVVTFCQDGEEKVLASSLGEGEDDRTYALHGTLAGTVVETGRSLIVENAKTCTDYGKAPEGYSAYLGVPLRTSQGNVIGTICAFHRKPRKFAAQEVGIAELFAERAATAIDNYYLYQQQQQFNDILEAEVAKRTEELRAAQEKLVEQERLAAIGEFAATIVHEIRNPLTTVMMGLNYFKRLDLSEPAQIRLGLALDEASRLERLLREILLYAKPQALQLVELEINEFVDKILGSLGSMPEAVGREIKFIPAATAIKIRGDKDKLKQVLINVVRNAYEALPEGEIVKLQVNNTLAPDRVCIQVHNDGLPISAEILPKLTEPFYSTKPSGTGLGLAIVKRIVEAHGGEFTIQSTAEEGTTVSVQLPQQFIGESSKEIDIAPRQLNSTL
jgi:hypothetical protein